MKKTYLAYFTLLLIFSSYHVNAKSNDKAIVDAYIKQHVKQQGGKEYKKARVLASGDVNHDDSADLVVNYSIEGSGGSNGFDQYLAVFSRLKKTIKPITQTRVGGELERHVNAISIKNNLIELTTLSHDENDARCCPSIAGKTYYVLSNGELQEHKTPPASDKK